MGLPLIGLAICLGLAQCENTIGVCPHCEHKEGVHISPIPISVSNCDFPSDLNGYSGFPPALEKLENLEQGETVPQVSSQHCCKLTLRLGANGL